MLRFYIFNGTIYHSLYRAEYAEKQCIFQKYLRFLKSAHTFYVQTFVTFFTFEKCMFLCKFCNRTIP
jgi:hypothetical protein